MHRFQALCLPGEMVGAAEGRVEAAPEPALGLAYGSDPPLYTETGVAACPALGSYSCACLLSALSCGLKIHSNHTSCDE